MSKAPETPPTAVDEPPMSGRRAEAARNDPRILESARTVFLADPDSPVSAVAKHAGVGMSAIYRRYPSKEDLLRTLCADGLARYIEAAERAVADDGDAWPAFASFMRDAVDTEASSLTQKLAGTFTPTPEMFEQAVYAGRLNVEIFDRARSAGVIRDDVDVNDLGLIHQQIASIHLGDDARSRQLRRRYLELMLDGLRAKRRPELPGPAPTDEELTARWRPRRRR